MLFFSILLCTILIFAAMVDDDATELQPLAFQKIFGDNTLTPKQAQSRPILLNAITCEHLPKHA